MNKLLSKLNRFMTIKSMICMAIVLFIIVSLFTGYVELGTATKLGSGTMQSLKQQCISFNRLVAADRTKSLYRLSDMMLDLSEDIMRNPSISTDKYLENYVDSLRLSGVALLNKNGVLEASGYTRQFRDANWQNSPDGSQFADIIEYPEKIYTERVLFDGEFYDVCAVARKDAQGILVGFYHQPSGLVTGTEDDLKTLLSGLKLERNGNYAIVENGKVRVASDEPLNNIKTADNILLKKMALVPKDGELHWISANGKYYLGYHSGCENYSIYVYYPVIAVFYSTIAMVAIVMALYCVLCLLYFAVRNQALNENQEELRRSNSGLKQTVQMLKALETIYFSLFYVDLETGLYDTVYVAKWLEPSIPKKGKYDDLKKLFVDVFIAPPFRDDIDIHMSVPYIREALNRQNLTDVRKSFYIDYQAIRKDKTPWCRVSATPVDFDESGKPLHFLALIQDIDKDKQREADYQARIIKEANDAKIANNAKTEFLRRISHDIRTPANAVQGYIEMANKNPENKELQKHCRDNVVSAVRILMDLVNSILDMSDLESNKIILEEKPFDLTELLNNVNTVLFPLANEKNVQYEVHRKDAVLLTHLIGSPRHLSQIIMNITSNAVKYTNPGGYVRVNTHLVSKTEDTVTYAFVCEDNGVGMTKEFVEHMYEPFTQEAKSARTTYEGVGLGLSIVKKLVDAMNGTIKCSSEKDVGTTFCTELTFKIDHSANDILPKTNIESLSLEDKSILLVEDNELNMEIAESLLLEHNAKVTKAWNGKDAVVAFKSSDINQFDLILMDIMMPEMGGREATRIIRNMDRPDAKTIPIISMSANSLQEDLQKNKAAGIDGHIPKPVNPDELKKVLSEYCPGEDLQ